MAEKRGRARLWHDVAVRSVKLLNILFITFPFAFLLVTYYSKQAYGGELGTYGNAAVIVLYVFAYSILVRIYDAFQISKVSRLELFFSQIITLALTDAVFYILLTIIIRALPDIFIFIVCIISQLIISYFWCLIVSWWYFKAFKKRKAVIIYDSIHNLNEIAKHDQFQKSFELMGVYDIDEVKKAPKSERDRWLIDKIKDAEVVFVMEINSHERNVVIKYCVENSISCYDEPKIGDILMRTSRQFNMYNLPIVLIERFSPTPEYMLIKRLSDIFLASLALAVTSPVLLFTALAVKITDGGPVIYKQKRLTKDGRVFEIYKFRSMRIDAEKFTGAILSSGKDDPRVTKIGRFIRKVRIDELPQLINIIKGDMSIVGPRPERPEIAEQYCKVLPEFRLRLQVRAGLTGYAQVYGRYDSDPYDKLSMDLYYISKAGVAQDLKIMFVTIKRILAKEPEFHVEDPDDDF